MIFLSGFDGKTLSSIMDYVYDGEVKLLQDDLDSFLDAAQKLKINGLLSQELNDQRSEVADVQNDDIKSKSQDIEYTYEKEIPTRSSQKFQNISTRVGSTRDK